MNALDLLAEREVVGNITASLRLPALLHHLHDLGMDRLLAGFLITLGVQLPHGLALAFARFQHRLPGFINGLSTRATLLLLLLRLGLIDAFYFLLVDQTRLQELFLQRDHILRSPVVNAPVQAVPDANG